MFLSVEKVNDGAASRRVGPMVFEEPDRRLRPGKPHADQPIGRVADGSGRAKVVQSL
jgi:hypothetical protein